MANAPLSETDVLGEYAFLPDCVQLNPTTDVDKRFPAVFIAVEGSPYVEGLGFFQSLEGPQWPDSDQDRCSECHNDREPALGWVPELDTN